MDILRKVKKYADHDRILFLIFFHFDDSTSVHQDIPGAYFSIKPPRPSSRPSKIDTMRFDFNVVRYPYKGNTVITLLGGSASVAFRNKKGKNR